MEKTQPLERCLEVFFQFFGCFGGCDFLDQIFKASSTHKKKTDVFLAFSHGKDMLQFVVFRSDLVLSEPMHEDTRYPFLIFSLRG